MSRENKAKRERERETAREIHGNGEDWTEGT